VLDRRRLLTTMGLLMVGGAGRAAAQAAGVALPADLLVEGEAHVAEVVDGDTVVIADGTQVRLVGLQAPKRALGRRGFVPWPLSEEAAEALSGLVLDQAVQLAYGGVQIDRYGRRLAHLVRAADGLWVQGEMIRRGLGRAYTNFADNRGGLRTLLAIEAEAREARRGIWGLRFYAIRRADALARADGEDAVDSFQLVEGVVKAVERVSGRTFLNFGEDWTTDFTGVVQPEDAGLFEAEGIDLARLQGRRIRLRGWVTWRNGPAIDIAIPEQIELVDQ
jgi:endonuclease YncB( thermonuclease family)